MCANVPSIVISVMDVIPIALRPSQPFDLGVFRIHRPLFFRPRLSIHDQPSLGPFDHVYINIWPIFPYLIEQALLSCEILHVR